MFTTLTRSLQNTSHHTHQTQVTTALEYGNHTHTQPHNKHTQTQTSQVFTALPQIITHTQAQSTHPKHTQTSHTPHTHTRTHSHTQVFTATSHTPHAGDDYGATVTNFKGSKIW